MRDIDTWYEDTVVAYLLNCTQLPTYPFHRRNEETRAVVTELFHSTNSEWCQMVPELWLGYPHLLEKCWYPWALVLEIFLQSSLLIRNESKNHRVNPHTNWVHQERHYLKYLPHVLMSAAQTNIDCRSHLGVYPSTEWSLEPLSLCDNIFCTRYLHTLDIDSGGKDGLAMNRWNRTLSFPSP